MVFSLFIYRSFRFLAENTPHPATVEADREGQLAKRKVGNNSESNGFPQKQ